MTATAVATTPLEAALPLLAAHRLADMLEHAARVTGYDHHELQVTDLSAVVMPDIATKDGRRTPVYRADVTGPDGVRYRLRFHDDPVLSDWEARNTVAVVFGAEAYLEKERDVFGPISHAAGRTAALTHDRYLATFPQHR